MEYIALREIENITRKQLKQAARDCFDCFKVFAVRAGLCSWSSTLSVGWVKTFRTDSTPTLADTRRSSFRRAEWSNQQHAATRFPVAKSLVLVSRY
jgi:hypothetical protein